MGLLQAYIISSNSGKQNNEAYKIIKNYLDNEKIQAEEQKKQVDAKILKLQELFLELLKIKNNAGTN